MAKQWFNLLFWQRSILDL